MDNILAGKNAERGIGQKIVREDQRQLVKQI
jgi:hypothetical protein